MSQLRSRVVALGSSVPNKIVTNQDLEKMMDTSDEWIVQRSGIKERRWAEESDSLLGLGMNAARQAMDKAKCEPDDIDAIIFTSLISDHIFPGTGVLIQRELGCKENIPALDIRNACSGFLYALSVGDAWIRSGTYKKILIVASEIHSTSLDKTTRGRDITVLFGDGAGACILEATDSEEGLIDIQIHSEGKNAEKLYLGKPSPNDHPRLPADGNFDETFYPHMEGKYVFKNAIVRMCETLTSVTKKNKVTFDDIDFVIAHQANMRINQAVLDQLGIPFEKTHHTIDRFGNTTAATIPLTLNEAMEKGKVKKGDLVALVAFGSGFTWGSALVRV